MPSVATVFLALLTATAAIVWAIRSLLKGSIPVRGQTNIPGPTDGYTLPFIGDAWRFARVKNMKDLHDVFQSLLNSTDKALALWLGPKLFILVKDPHLGEAILNSSKTIKDPDMYGGFNAMSDGIISRNGKGWRELRRPLNRLLQSSNVMGKYFVVFQQKAEELCDTMSNMCGKGQWDVQKRIQYCFLDIVFETLLGIPGESKSPDCVELNVISKLVSICMQLAVNPLYKLGYLISSSPVTKEMKRIQSMGLSWAKRMIESRRKVLGANSMDAYGPDHLADSYIDVVMQLNKEMIHNDEYRGVSTMFDLIAAGYDTTSVTVSSSILFLAMYPEYQEKAYQEQEKIMGNSIRPPTVEQISKMRYLWMVNQETLRHVGGLGVVRLMTSEFTYDDFIIPEGASIFVSQHSFHMKPEYWVKTKEFYPDHFLPEHIANRPKSAWLPFITGARACPGKVYADTTYKTILSMLLRRFKFTTKLKFEDMEYKITLMLESNKGYPVEVERRVPTA